MDLHNFGYTIDYIFPHFFILQRMSKVTTQEQMDIIEAARNIVDKTPEEVEGI